MIRQIHNANIHHLAAHSAARPAAKTSAGTGSFRSVLHSTTTSSFSDLFSSSSANTTSGTPADATAGTPATTTAPAQITGTVVKAATPALTLGQPAFEPNPTVTNPDGSVAALNWTQFADDATAQQMAAKLGGKVSSSNTDGYSATQRSIKVPGSQNLVNAGIAAQLFAQYGDKPGSQAWQIINRDLGRDPMST